MAGGTGSRLGGAVLSGVEIALEMARYPHYLQVVGFVDDDLSEQGCLIAGDTVVGSSGRIRDLFAKTG